MLYTNLTAQSQHKVAIIKTSSQPEDIRLANMSLRPMKKMKNDEADEDEDGRS
jgi:hypothetical protein